jgi:hypothetical protein
MTAKKLLVLFLSVVFLFGSSGLAVATDHEKKAEKKGEKAEKVAEKKAAKAKNADGTVKAASADSLTVVGKGNKEWMFSVDAKTSIKKGGKAITAADLKAGDPVQVRFTEADGKMMAQAITVKAGGTAKKMEKKAENPCAAKK